MLLPFLTCGFLTLSSGCSTQPLVVTKSLHPPAETMVKAIDPKEFTGFTVNDLVEDYLYLLTLYRINQTRHNNLVDWIQHNNKNK